MRKIFLAMILAAFLSGCSKEEEVHTVDWFLANETEWNEQLAKCRANPGQLGNTPNCINAITVSRMKSSRGEMPKGW